MENHPLDRLGPGNLLEVLKKDLHIVLKHAAGLLVVGEKLHLKRNQDRDYFRLFVVVTSYSDVSVSFLSRHPLLSGDIVLTAGFDSVTLPNSVLQHFLLVSGHYCNFLIGIGCRVELDLEKTNWHLSINGNGSLLARSNENPLLVHLGELTWVVQQHLKKINNSVFH